MKRGFSLIELLVVVAIVAILVGVATPYYSDYVKESKRTKALQDLDVLKQAVVLFNSQEDLPYQGQVATTAPYLPILGENDFNGLQGRYLTYIPVDPWGKNYKLDPYACFVYSEGPDSRIESDDIRDYYVKDLAMIKIEWEDIDNDRTMNNGDYLHFHFNKSVWVEGPGIAASDFDIYENNEATTSVTLGLTFGPTPSGYSDTNASASTLICTISGGNVKLGVHSLAFKDDLGVLRKYEEVTYDRETPPGDFRTKRNLRAGLPVRYAVRTNPIKITPK